MRKAILSMAIAAGLALNGAAQAADFATIRANKNMAVLIDFESRVMKGNVARVWGLALEAEPRTRDFVEKPYDYALGLSEYDCQGRRMRHGPSTYYVAKGTSVGSADSWGDWSDVIPSTRGEAMLKAACTTDTKQFEMRFKDPIEALELYRQVVDESELAK